VSLSPSLQLRGTAYEGDSIEQGIGSLQSTLRARWRDVSVEYNLILVQGDSPFEFDTEVATHHVGWDITRYGWGTLNIDSGISLDTGLLDPLCAQLAWTDWANWTFNAEYDVTEVTLTSLLLTGTWASDRLRLHWSIPYLPEESRLDDVTLSGEVPGEWIDLEIDAVLDQGYLTVTTELTGTITIDAFTCSGEVELSNLDFANVSLASEYVSSSGWGAKVAWTHSGGSLSLASVSYGIFWDIGDCLRIGIDREASEIWVYASILAFPEAVLRYAPETASVQVGE